MIKLTEINKNPSFKSWGFYGGGDFRKFEPVVALKALSYGRIDKIIRRLRLFYKENPVSFEVPAFAQKVY